MSGFEAIIYGMVQGLTEYLPVSSSAHLILLPRFLDWKDPGLTFDVILHFGTLLSTLIYFKKDWVLVWKSLPIHKTPARPEIDWKLLSMGTFPVLVAGVLFHDYAETIFRGPMVLAWTLSIGGFLLFLVDRFFPQNKNQEHLSSKEAWGVGLIQCFALIPGVSRSGSTMTGGRMLGLDRETSARFSFLISGPVTAAAVIYELKNYQELFHSGVEASHLIIGCFSAFIFGWIAIDSLLKIVKRFGYLSFAIYRIALGILIWKTLV
ncbi:MAG: hypothetical protein CL678_09990 [Bdellovibrionaceae bacterium]|nr:hypothetical protein [Pseudobdellovibrionaceae bacterium]|tara:strand:- start:4483 stop:5274 length:792 start_codon:yes stop_codon:yes gene_type:complete